MKASIYSLQHVAEIISAKTFLAIPDHGIEQLVIDSRKIVDAAHSLFFALASARDGHDFITDAYATGIRNFVISKPEAMQNLKDVANFLVVEDTLQAMQELAAYHRRQHDLKVLAITGSNGKTIVKEWLYQLLAVDFNIVRSPKSFNSQIGVPLSIWQIEPDHTLGIFEAGISKEAEMDVLRHIIQPSVGILTNIGEAHAEGFGSVREKLSEKLKLFANTELFVYCPEYVQGIPLNVLPGARQFSWSYKPGADLYILFVEPIQGHSYIRGMYKGVEIECLIPFRDKASVENGIVCWATLLALDYTPEEADLRLEKLMLVSMRLELKNGINQCSIIDDSYIADISSLAVALDFLYLQKQHPKRTLILSDLYETGKNDIVLYEEIAALLKSKELNRLIGIGPHISASAELFNEIEAVFYPDTQAFIDNLPAVSFNNETILVKGARRFEFERISKLLTQKIHDTVLEIDLNALAQNLQFYRAKLKPGVKTMAMVKAFSYGSGSFEIANLLQYHKVDYLAVAYADEGIALRKAGITMPIMVMSPEPSAFEALVKHQLEPEIYNLEILEQLIDFLGEHEYGYAIHLKIDTGMNRLGFSELDIDQVIGFLNTTKKTRVMSVFSHLVGSDDPQHDEFTKYQTERFAAICDKLELGLGYSFICHIANTAAVSRHPDTQLDMVRLGIGLYGFDAGSGGDGLQTVAVLKTTITQVKEIKPYETVGYNRKGMLAEGGKIATVKIGYADGYRRAFGNGVGQMRVHGKLAPTVGSICMDMCMLDVSDMDVKTGDEVIVFDGELTIADLAAQVDTIPYEILCNVSQRVKRVYFYE